ncbi:hypothetical protein SESBI_11947 [Sesbania bispinosa]|nr:hypothetical protein SESBI_11947 [Sesbania bispinosa]
MVGTLRSTAAIMERSERGGISFTPSLFLLSDFSFCLWLDFGLIMDIVMAGDIITEVKGTT